MKRGGGTLEKQIEKKQGGQTPRDWYEAPVALMSVIRIGILTVSIKYKRFFNWSIYYV